MSSVSSHGVAPRSQPNKINGISIDACTGKHHNAPCVAAQDDYYGMVAMPARLAAVISASKSVFVWRCRDIGSFR